MVRYRDDYDSYITIYLLQTDDAYRPIFRSFTDIYRIVARYGNPKVGKDTVQRHLNRLVENKMIVRLQWEGRQYNKTLYMLSPKGKVNMEQRPKSLRHKKR
jgi:Fe2+ or Zn2+ uptake regulation protein